MPRRDCSGVPHRPPNQTMNDTIEWVIAGRLARACRPGRWTEGELNAVVHAWIARAQQMGIRSIVCLLTDDELERYYTRAGVNLLHCYTEAGFRVGRVPVPDHEEPHVTDDELRQVHEVLRTLPPPWLVHCSAGVDRTGCVIKSLAVERPLPPT